MDFLTVKEAAELKGCSERYVQKLIKDGKLQAEMRMDQSIRQMRYMIPISALPEALQAKWYKRQKAAAGLLPEVKEPPVKASKQKKPQRTFEELSEAERREVTLWTAILQEWQGLRANYSSKTEFDKLYVGKCQLDHPDVKVSVDILYRKYAAYKAKDMEGLIDKRGAWNKGKSTIPAPVWDAFLWFWLDENRPTASLCYRETIRWTAEFYPELVDLIPTERCFRRHIDNDLSKAVKTLMRDGEKAFNDRCMPYIIRMYDAQRYYDEFAADSQQSNPESAGSAAVKPESSETAADKSVDALAAEVLAGTWGNGAERRERLTAAGYDYTAVQKRVNRMCGLAHHVSGGDTLTKIAAKYGTTVEEIVAKNRKQYPAITADYIEAGWTLRV